MTYDHDAVLTMWAAGFKSAEIARQLGMRGSEAVRTIVRRSRAGGDARASKRKAGRPRVIKAVSARLTADKWQERLSAAGF